MPCIALLNAVSCTPLSSAGVTDNIVLGSEAKVDVRQQALTNWGLAAGYLHNDYSAMAALTERGSKLRFMYSQRVDERTSVAAEVSRDLAARQEAQKADAAEGVPPDSVSVGLSRRCVTVGQG